SVDQGVEPGPLGLAQPGHGRHARRREQLLPLAATRPPGHLALEAVLGLPRDANALVARIFPEPANPRRERRGPAVFAEITPELRHAEGSDDEDLVTISSDGHRVG